MDCTEAYKEHIEYTFNAFCRVVIHYAAINAWRDRDKRRQREILPPLCPLCRSTAWHEIQNVFERQCI